MKISAAQIAGQKTNGFRVILFARPGLVMLQSRQGADLTGVFPDIAEAAAGLSEALVLDGEFVVLREGRLRFGQSYDPAPMARGASSHPVVRVGRAPGPADGTAVDARGPHGAAPCPGGSRPTSGDRP